MEVEENHSCTAHEGQTPPSSPSSPSVPDSSRLLLAPPRRASQLLLTGLQTPATPRLLGSRLQPPSSPELPRDRPQDSDFPDNEPNSTSSVSAKLLQALPGSSTRSPSPSCHLFSLPPSPIHIPLKMHGGRHESCVHGSNSQRAPISLTPSLPPSLSLSLCPASSQAPPLAAPRLPASLAHSSQRASISLTPSLPPLSLSLCPASSQAPPSAAPRLPASLAHSSQ